jgi:single-strand DNA-binding protein
MNGITAALTGRVGKDPELKYTMSGKKMLSFSVAIDESQHQADERPDPAETVWVRVTCWEELAARLEEEGRVKKGCQVYVEGRLRLDRWATADGTPMAGLSMSAWVVQPMGNLGERRRPRPADQLEGVAF